MDTHNHVDAGKCARCGEAWPCTVRRNPRAYRADILATHTYLPPFDPDADPAIRISGRGNDDIDP